MIQLLLVLNESSLKQETTENQKLSQKLNPHNISMENASYIENNIDVENKIDNLKQMKIILQNYFLRTYHKIEEEKILKMKNYLIKLQ